MEDTRAPVKLPAPGLYWYFGSYRNNYTGEVVRMGPELVTVKEEEIKSAFWSASRKTWETMTRHLPPILVPCIAPTLSPSGEVDWVPGLVRLIESLRTQGAGDPDDKAREVLREALNRAGVYGANGCRLCLG